MLHFITSFFISPLKVCCFFFLNSSYTTMLEWFFLMWCSSTHLNLASCSITRKIKGFFTRSNHIPTLTYFRRCIILCVIDRQLMLLNSWRAIHFLIWVFSIIANIWSLFYFLLNIKQAPQKQCIQSCLYLLFFNQFFIICLICLNVFLQTLRCFEEIGICFIFSPLFLKGDSTTMLFYYTYFSFIVGMSSMCLNDHTIISTFRTKACQICWFHFLHLF